MNVQAASNLQDRKQARRVHQVSSPGQLVALAPLPALATSALRLPARTTITVCPLLWRDSKGSISSVELQTSLACRSSSSGWPLRVQLTSISRRVSLARNYPISCRTEWLAIRDQQGLECARAHTCGSPISRLHGHPAPDKRSWPSEQEENGWTNGRIVGSSLNESAGRPLSAYTW